MPDLRPHRLEPRPGWSDCARILEPYNATAQRGWSNLCSTEASRDDVWSIRLACPRASGSGCLWTLPTCDVASSDRRRPWYAPHWWGRMLQDQTALTNLNARIAVYC